MLFGVLCFCLLDILLFALISAGMHYAHIAPYIEAPKSLQHVSDMLSTP
jgi:hypothetical protein